MCCARVIAGVGAGVIACVVPVWSAEVSSHQARGAFLAIEFFMVSRCLERLYLFVYFEAYLGPEYRGFSPCLLDRIFCIFGFEQGDGMADTSSASNRFHHNYWNWYC